MYSEREVPSFHLFREPTHWTSFSFFSSLWVNIDGLRRAPDSYHDLRFYSEGIYDFKAKDDMKRYVRFRMIPADGAPETGRLTKEEQRKAWWVFYRKC